MVKEMVLRGFSGRLGDLRGRMRFCHPILSAKGGGIDLFVATDMHWRSDGTGLEPVNEDEIGSFGTLWPESTRIISPGIGVALIGSDFMQSVSASVGSDEAKGFGFTWEDELGCWIAICRRAEFDECARRLATLSRAVFDRELRTCASESDKLSRAGASALFVLRRAPGRRDTDVAMRELAAANVQGDHDLYRRLLSVLSIKLGVDKDALDSQAKRHVESIRSAVFVKGLDPQNARLVHKVKSTQLASRPAVGGGKKWTSDVPCKKLVTYYAVLTADERRTASSGKKVIYSTIVHYRPLKLGRLLSAFFGLVGSDIRERTYGRKWKQTQDTRRIAVGG